MLQNSPKESYLKISHQAFTNNHVIAECHNIMQIFEILMIAPSMNAIVEHLSKERLNQRQTFVIDYQDLYWMYVSECQRRRT